MSWAAAQRDAEPRAAEILRLVSSLPEPPVSLPIAFYPSPRDYRDLRPGEPWSWEHWCAVHRAVKRILKRHGLRVESVECTAADCLSWLDANGLPNSPENRAAYVASVTRT